jgi:hypothetical protein
VEYTKLTSCRFRGNRAVKYGSSLFSVGEHVELRPGGSIRKLAGGANPELSTQLFGCNSEGRSTQREGETTGRFENEHAGHERDFALFAAGLTSDEANPLFFYHEEHEGGEG